MTDAYAPGACLRLHSQTPYDDRGNFHYQGDFYRSGETLDMVSSRIGQHLAAFFPEMRFAITTQKFSGGRKILAEITDAPDDLTGRDIQNDCVTRVQDQMLRFGFVRANPLQDFHSTSFYCEARIAQDYWSALAKRRGPENPVEAHLSLASFKKQLKVGDQLKLLAAPVGHRALGTMRTITAVRSNDLILEGQVYLTFPRAAQFACDGKHVRIAIGSDHAPDAHLLYEWHRSASPRS